MDNLKNRVTIYEVAKISGVSLATVSRVINNKDNVTEKTKIKVRKVIESLGYKPSGVAKALATNKSTNIGVIIPSANYVYIANMLNGIAEEARNSGFDISLFTTSHDKKEVIEVVEKVIQSHVDGAIIFDDELDVAEIETIASYTVPVIAVNNKIVAETVGCITLGVERLFKEILSKQLLRDKSKPMIFLHVSNAGRLLERVERMFVTTHNELSKPYSIYDCDDSYTKTYNDFLDVFKTTKKGYYIAYRDSIAAAVINAATDSNLRVPEDIEVLSLIGTKYANIIRPTISSLHLDMHQIGIKSMQMLNQLLNNELSEKKEKVRSVYVKRDSTEE